MVLRSMVLTFFRLHQREFALERGVVHPSLMLWLDPVYEFCLVTDSVHFVAM